MTTSTDGILAYGYDLGGDEEWKIREAGEYGELPELPWFDEDDEEGEGFQEAAERRLLAELASFTETWSPASEGYFEREEAAKARLGVEFETYCSGDYPSYLLATKVITVARGDVEHIDMVELVEAPNVHGWDAKLTAALQVLGLTPIQERARWLLCSYWG
jgi:hypothetical protein